MTLDIAKVDPNRLSTFELRGTIDPVRDSNRAEHSLIVVLKFPVLNRDQTG